MRVPILCGFLLASLAFAEIDNPKATADDVHDDTAVERAAGGDPLECLKTIKKPPPLYLAAEIRNDQRCEDIRRCKMILANEQYCHVGIDGALCGDSDMIKRMLKSMSVDMNEKSGLRGYTDPIQHGVTFALRTLEKTENFSAKKNLADRQLGHVTTAAMFAEQLNQSPFLMEAWKEFEKGKFEGDQAKIVKSLQSAIQAGDYDHAKLVLAHEGAEETPTALVNGGGPLLEVLRNFTRATTKLAKTPRWKTGRVVPEMMDKNVEAFIANDDRREVGNALAVEWANTSQLNNILKIYCEAAKAGKPVHIITAAQGAQNLKMLIELKAEKRFKVVPVNALDEYQDYMFQLRDGKAWNPEGVKVK